MKIPDNISKEKSLSVSQVVEINLEGNSKEDALFDYWMGEYVEKDDKSKVKFIKGIESLVRGSIELKDLFKYLKGELKLDECNILKGVTLSNSIIELHHYPFTLFDIVDIVLKKRIDKEEDINPISVAEEVVFIHYKKMVGLIPLSRTAHELAHSGALALSPNSIFGDVKRFMEEYNIGLTSQHIETVKILMSGAKSDKIDAMNKRIFTQNLITWKEVSSEEDVES